VRCESTTNIARPPAEVFPWLIEPDKVRQWMTGLQVYQPLGAGPIIIGSRIRQELAVSGPQLKFELEVTRLEPPSAAELRFEGSGFKAVNEYTVTFANGGSGAAVTWVISGDTTSFKAKLLAPMVQAKLEEKLDTDLVRLRSLLG
jgi:carbon monoxide dehydrogenase subunit G